MALRVKRIFKKETLLSLCKFKILSIGSILFFCLFIFRASPITQGYDSRWSLYVTQSVLHEGNLNLDEYKTEIVESGSYGIYKVHKNNYSYFPVGSSFLAIPALWIVEKFPATSSRVLSCSFQVNPTDSQKLVLRSSYQCLERGVASAVTLLTIFILYLLFLLITTPCIALVTAGLFALATSAYSIASRALWQHSASMFLLSLALLFFVYADKYKTKCWVLAGFSLAFAYWVRPTNSLAIVCFSVYVLYQYRRESIKFFSALVVGLLPLFAINLMLYGSCLAPYYQATRLQLSAGFPLAFAAQWISPSRGLLFFSPFLIWGVVEALRQLRKPSAVLWPLLSLLVFAHTVILGLFPIWWGGHCFGPRLMCDLLPILCIFFALHMNRLQPKISWIHAAVLVLACVSAGYIHTHGATDLAPYAWNLQPENVDKNPLRVWNIFDPQWLRE